MSLVTYIAAVLLAAASAYTGLVLLGVLFGLIAAYHVFESEIKIGKAHLAEVFSGSMRTDP